MVALGWRGCKLSVARNEHPRLVTLSPLLSTRLSELIKLAQTPGWLPEWVIVQATGESSEKRVRSMDGTLFSLRANLNSLHLPFALLLPKPCNVTVILLEISDVLICGSTSPTNHIAFIFPCLGSFLFLYSVNTSTQSRHDGNSCDLTVVFKTIQNDGIKSKLAAIMLTMASWSTLFMYHHFLSFLS